MIFRSMRIRKMSESEREEFRKGIIGPLVNFGRIDYVMSNGI